MRRPGDVRARERPLGIHVHKVLRRTVSPSGESATRDQPGAVLTACAVVTGASRNMRVSELLTRQLR